MREPEADRNMSRLVRVIEKRKRISKELRDKLSPYARARAEADPHSRRKPRPCGMTIHTGVGCSYRCLYCYIFGMGFPGKISTYPLTPLELTYALSLNPYIAPGYTFAAYGSVTEPFAPETRNIAIEYIREVYRWLQMPSQVSTKSVVDEELAKALKSAEPNLSLLITIVTLDRYRELEPNAPSPAERFAGASIATKYGLYVSLFLRPVIPGVTDREVHKIVKMAVESGINSVVIGTLRVTPSIVSRLRSVDPAVAQEVLRRVPKQFYNIRNSRKQIAIRGDDLKKKIAAIARDYGMKVYASACSANIDAHNEYCYACHYGPCGNPSKIPQFYDTDIIDFLEYLGFKRISVEMSDDTISLKLDKDREALLEIIKYILMFTVRRRIVLKFK